MDIKEMEKKMGELQEQIRKILQKRILHTKDIQEYQRLKAELEVLKSNYINLMYKKS